MSIIPRFFGGRKTNNTDPVSLDIWDPFDELSFAYLPNLAPEAASLAYVRIDWKETPETHIFTADMPGLNREQVKVEIEEGGILKISGVRSKEKEEKDTLWHRIERGVGNFLRQFRLPENVKTDDVKANMDNGVLTVTVPKKEEKKPGVRTIEIA